MPVPVLVEVVGHMEGRRILLNRDVTLGRVAAPGVTAVPNREVSRRHCCVSQQDDGKILVEDLGSANGTWVNGQRTNRSIVTNGDRIALGRTVFEIQLDTLADEVPTLDGGGSTPSPRAPAIRTALNNDQAVMDTGLSIDASASQFGRLPQDLSNLLEVAHHRDLLHRLCELSRSMATTTDIAALSDQITQACLEMFPTARRSHVVLARGTGLKLLATRHRTPQGSEGVAVKEGELPISRSILDRALRQRESISSVDAAVDDRFMGQHSVVINNIRAFMCAPLLFQQEVLGAILVDTTVGSKGFTGQDLEMLTAVGAQLAVQVKAVQLIAENLKQAEVRVHLSRYLSPSLVEQVLDGKVDLKLGGEMREGAILFSDLVGFTSLSEKLGATALVRLLNHHFSRMVASVFDEGGSVNKFGGDSLLAVWGLTKADPEDALGAARAGILMQNALFELNLQTGISLGMGIGINCGGFVAGNVGSAQQMEYTVLGDSVNIAQRVESQAGPTQVLLSSDTFDRVEASVGGFSLPPVTLKGKAEPAALFSLRSVALGDGAYLTTLPALIRMKGQDQPWTSAIVIKVKSGEGGLTLELRSESLPGEPSSGQLEIEISPPEFPGIERWVADITQLGSIASPGDHFELLSLTVQAKSAHCPSLLSTMIEPKAGCVPVPRR